MPSSDQPEGLREQPLKPHPPAPAENGLVRHARRLILGVVGTTVILFGVAMLVLPGPGAVVLLLGLSILAAEFAWARSLLKRIKREGKRFVPERFHGFFRLRR